MRWLTTFALILAWEGAALGQRLLIFPLEVETPRLSYLRMALPEMLASRLSAEGMEVKVTLKAPGTSREVAKREGIPWTLTGNFRLKGGQGRLTLRLIRVKDGAEFPLEVKAPLGEVIERLGKVAAQVQLLVSQKAFVPSSPQR